jgi:phosphate transport system substrate-binding protein
MKTQEFKDAVAKDVLPVAHVVAMDGVCIVVHPSNPVSALSTEQVRDIYLGKIKNWNQVGGPSTPIVAISRDTASGTYETFELRYGRRKIDSSVGTSYNPRPINIKNTQDASVYIGYRLSRQT